jgi:hypothetical protein
MTTKDRSLSSDTLLMIQSFGEANPEFLRNAATAFAGSAHCWHWLAWLSKMINGRSVGGLRSA